MTPVDHVTSVEQTAPVIHVTPADDASDHEQTLPIHTNIHIDTQTYIIVEIQADIMVIKIEHTTHDINPRYRPREYVHRPTRYTAPAYQYEHQHYLPQPNYDYRWFHQQQQQQLGPNPWYYATPKIDTYNQSQTHQQANDVNQVQFAAPASPYQ